MKKQPNVMIVTLHDAGRHFGCYGVETVRSPAIDALAQDGVLFNNYYAVSPVCSPSRGTMFTGRYPQSNGLMGLTHEPWNWSLHEGERHLSHIMKDAGYKTALFGIQHETNDVERLAFEERYALGGGEGPSGPYVPCAAVIRDVAQFLEGEALHSDRPFYAQIGLFETHRPFDVGGVVEDHSQGVYVPPYIQCNEAALSQFAHLQGAVASVDTAISSLMDSLRATGLEQNTLLVFTVDHGIEFPRAKWYCYDPGIEIALIMRWPDGGLTGGRQVDALLSNVDLLPTIIELIAAPLPGDMDGISFSSLAKGDNEASARQAVYSIFEGMLTLHYPSVSRAVRTKRYKLIRNFLPTRKHEVPIDLSFPQLKDKCPVVQLFDLEKDPNEFVNVADDPLYAEAYEEMSALLWKWLENVRDPILQGPTRTPYYEEAIAEYVAVHQDTVSPSKP